MSTYRICQRRVQASRSAWLLPGLGGEVGNLQLAVSKASVKQIPNGKHRKKFQMTKIKIQTLLSEQ